MTYTTTEITSGDAEATLDHPPKFSSDSGWDPGIASAKRGSGLAFGRIGKRAAAGQRERLAGPPPAATA